MKFNPKGLMDDTIIPIQLRPDVTVRIQGIPHDLTDAEADRIERIITAMVLRPHTLMPELGEEPNQYPI
jgi:hypothetical protein